MMELMIRLAAVGVTAAVLCAVLRKNTPELALLLGLAAGDALGHAVNDKNLEQIRQA